MLRLKKNQRFNTMNAYCLAQIELMKFWIKHGHSEMEFVTSGLAKLFSEHHRAY